LANNKHPDLPSYQRPPLVEVAISVRFSCQGDINIAHLGAFWSKVSTRFPRVASTQPIVTRGDDAGAKWTPPSIRFALSNTPDCRLQMICPDDEAWMWQVQSDRLVVNWRKQPDKQYPRYRTTADQLREAWKQWVRFLSDHGIQASAIGWEVTYVNEIPSGLGELWSSPEDLPEVLPGLFGGPFRAEKGLKLAGLHGEWVWDHHNPKARLIVNPVPARRKDQDVLMLNLTASGLTEKGPSQAEEEADESGTSLPKSVNDGLNLGHRLIVNTFDTLGSIQAKAHWERQ
jgi:uncharacterized protein (TIGR04255 family)